MTGAVVVFLLVCGFFSAFASTPIEYYNTTTYTGSQTYSVFWYDEGTISSGFTWMGEPISDSYQQVLSSIPPAGAKTVTTDPGSDPVWETDYTDYTPVAGDDTWTNTSTFTVALSAVLVNPTLLRQVTWSQIQAVAPSMQGWLSPDTLVESTDPVIEQFVNSVLPSDYVSSTTPYDAAQDLFNAVVARTTYTSSPSCYDAVCVYNSQQGDCLGFSTLLNACLRYVGIPSRCICGFLSGTNAWHCILEFYFPGLGSGYGWIPADGASNLFGNDPNLNELCVVSRGTDHYVSDFTTTYLQTGAYSYSFTGGTPPEAKGDSTTSSLIPIQGQVPPVPTGLSAGAGNGSVTLSWTSSAGATSYSVYRATTSGAEGSTAVGMAAGAAYTDTGLTNNVQYYYTVAAENSNGTSAQSNEASATPEASAPPSAPTNLVATSGDTQVMLSWTQSAGATSYDIYRATTSGAEGSKASGTATGTSYTDTGLANGDQYFYTVAAVNADGTSAQSTEVAATPAATGPPAPTGLIAIAGNMQVSLSWTASAGATSYNVYRGTSSGGESSTAVGMTTGTAYTDSGLSNGVTYYYEVAAVDGMGTSARSNEAAAIFEPAPSPAAHVLWSNSGALSLWNYNPSTGSYTQNSYGPYAGWTPTEIADGPDGLTRVLWVSTGGAAAIWSVNTSTGAFTQNTFGPYPDWTATALSVNPSGTTHVLWTSTNGAAAIWNYTGMPSITQATFGPFPDWGATTIADGPDGLTRVLWVSSGGAASIWSLDESTEAFTQDSFGPYTGWAATDISVNAANTTHVLWTTTGGAAALWNVNLSTGNFTQNSFGPYPGWTPTSITDGPDGNAQLLWTSTAGGASIWDLDNVTGAFTQDTFGPFKGWIATALAAYP